MSEYLIAVVLPWCISGMLALSIGLIIISLPRLCTPFLSLSNWAKMLLMLSICTGAFIRFVYVPNYHRIYYDEDRYLSYAVSFARFGKAVSLEAATPDRSIIGVPDQVIRTTVPVLNAWVFKTFGYDEVYAFQTAKVFSIGQIVLIFLLAILVFEDAIVACIAAVGMALLPGPIYWSVSTALDSYFIFFTLFAMVSSCWYARRASIVSGLLMISSVFLLLCVRFESFLVLPILLAFGVILRTRSGQKLVQSTDLMMGVIGGCLISFRAVLSLSSLGKPWCCADALPLEAFDSGYVLRNVIPNIGALFIKPEFPGSISVLAVYGVLTRKDWRMYVVGIWAAIFFGIYSFYYAGMFYLIEFSGSYGRYFLMLIPPILLLCGKTASDILRHRLMYDRKRSVNTYIGILISLLTLLPTIIAYPGMIAVSPYDRFVEAGPRALHRSLEQEIIPKLPPQSMLIHSLTTYVLLKGYPTILSSTFLQDDRAISEVKDYLATGHRVFSIEYPSCAVFVQKCDKINKFFTTKPFLKSDGKTMPLGIVEVLRK